MRTKQCAKCKRNITLNNYKKHINSCNGKKKNVDISKLKFSNNKYECPYCKKQFVKLGICSHIWRMHEGGKNWKKCFDGYKNGTRIIWNKGLTKKTDERIKKISETYKKNIKDGIIIPSFLGKTHSKETREKISKRMSANNHGGKCKWYSVNNVKVQGTWERDLAIHMNKLNIKWTKISSSIYTLPYIMNNKKRHYTPDFLLNNLNVLLELKGYWWGNDKEKMKLVFEQNTINNLYVIEKEKYYKLLKTKTIKEFEKIIKDC